MTTTQPSRENTLTFSPSRRKVQRGAMTGSNIGMKLAWRDGVVSMPVANHSLATEPAVMPKSTTSPRSVSGADRTESLTNTQGSSRK